MTNIHVSVTWPSPSLVPRAMVAHDYQSTDVDPDYRPRTWQKCQTLPSEKWYGTAETEKYFVSNKERLEKAWQFLAFDMFSYYGKAYSVSVLKSKWADFMHGAKFITNGAGSETNADYINGTNLDKEDMKQETITCGGNVMVLSGNKRTISGVPCTGVLLLDRSYPPPSFETLLNHPYHSCFVHAATVCRPEAGTQANFPRNAYAPNGTHIVNHFPHFDGALVPFLNSTFQGSRFTGTRFSPPKGRPSNGRAASTLQIEYLQMGAAKAERQVSIVVLITTPQRPTRTRPSSSIR